MASRHPHSLDLRTIASPARASKGPGKGNPKLKLLGAGALLVLGLYSFASARAQADVIYTYTGNPFTNGTNGSPPPDPPYTTSDKVTGQFVEAAPLPANLTFQTISPISFSFTDGVQTITNLDASASTEITVATDAAGQISVWEIVIDSTTSSSFIITESVLPGSPAQDEVALGSRFIGASVNNDPGVWSVPAPIVGAGIPGLLAGLGAFLFWRGRSAAAAFVRRRSRSYQPAAS